MSSAVSDIPPEASGVYFLERDSAIVYVGSSEYPSLRVFTHDRCQGKDFAAAWFLPVEEAERLAVERFWIRTLCPVHNKQWNPRPDPHSPGCGQDPDSENVAVVLDADIVAKARLIAARRHLRTSVFLSRILAPIVDADYAAVAADMIKEVGKARRKPD